MSTRATQPPQRAHERITTPTRTITRQAYYVDEVAVMLGIGRSTAYELVRQGVIHSTRVGRRILVSQREVDRLLGEPYPER